jgi:hypothetical protein
LPKTIHSCCAEFCLATIDLKMAVYPPHEDVDGQLRSSRGLREQTPSRFWFISSVDRQPGSGGVSLARDRRLSARRAVRFRQVESLALTNLHKFGLAEPSARAVVKPLDVASRPVVIAFRQGFGVLAADKAGGGVRSRADVLGGTSLHAMEPLIRSPGNGGSGRTLAWSGRGVCQRQRRRGPTVLPASASFRADCF